MEDHYCSISTIRRSLSEISHFDLEEAAKQTCSPFVSRTTSQEPRASRGRRPSRYDEKIRLLMSDMIPDRRHSLNDLPTEGLVLDLPPQRKRAATDCEMLIEEINTAKRNSSRSTMCSDTSELMMFREADSDDWMVKSLAFGELDDDHLAF